MKLNPDFQSPLRKLKRLLPEERAEVYAWAFPPEGGEATKLTNAQIRKLIAERWGIQLRRDGQLSEFWPWQEQQAAQEYLGAKMQQDEADLSDKFPELSREKIRDAVIKRHYALAEMKGDSKLALKVVAADLKDSADRREWEIWKKKAAQADKAKGLLENKELSEEQRAARMRELFGIS